jgi:hypothetical protein
MIYEIPLPMPDKLLAKPILNAKDVHEYLERNGFRPLIVSVDNSKARITIYFDKELNDEEKKDLTDAVLDFYRKWIDGEDYE